MNTSEGKFMVAVGAIIENIETGKILLLQRAKKADYAPGIWEEITGRMKQFEELEAALHREIEEEAGIKEFEIIKPLTVNHFYRGDRTADNEIILIIYWVKTETEQIIISGEHEDYKWVAPEEALSVVDHPGVKKISKHLSKKELHSSTYKPVQLVGQRG